MEQEKMKNSMRKLKYTTLCIAGFWVLVLAFLAVAYTVPPFFATKTYCENLKSSTSKEHAEYIRYYIDSMSEKRGLAWKNRVHPHQSLWKPYAQVIDQSPQLYVGEAMQIMLSKEYDESQRFYTGLMMQRLPVRSYLCFFDTIYESHYNQLINKDITSELVYIDGERNSPIALYWWHPSYTQRFLKHNPGKTNENMPDNFGDGTL